MKCKQCHKKLIIWQEGSASQKEKEAVESHLAVCAACRGFADYLRETLELAAAEAKIEEDPWFYARVKSRIDKELQGATGEGWGGIFQPARRGILQPAFFSLLLLLGIYSGIRLGGMLQRESSQTLASEMFVPWMNEMATEPMETFLMQ